MVITAEKYSVRVEANNPAKELRDALPIWYHLGTMAEQIMGNSPSNRCLRDNHKVMTVLDCITVATWAESFEEHKKSPACPCLACHEDRTIRNCENPVRCIEAAKKLTKQLMPKWSPKENPTKDGLSLTRSRKRRNMIAKAENGQILFDPSLVDGPAIEMVVRVFAGPADLPSQAVRRAPKPFGIEPEEVEVYTDGSCEENGDARAMAGSGLWYGWDDPRNVALRVPGEQSNQMAELYAVEATADRTPPFATLNLVTDSKFVIRGLTDNLARWEDRGWLGAAHPQEMQWVISKLRARSAPTTFRWVKGHSGVEGNEATDDLARKGAAIPCPRSVVPGKNEFLQKGAKLSAATQRLLYRGIRRTKETKCEPREKTVMVVERVCDTIEETLHYRPRPRTLWKALKAKDVNRKARAFLWKGMHDALKIGKYWEHIPGYETRANCGICGETETLEHILLECEAKAVRTIWGLVRAVATKKGIKLPKLLFGLVLGAPTFSAKAIMEKVPPGADRLIRIAVTEAAYLIWVLRCERVIGQGGTKDVEHPEREVSAKWHAAMARRQMVDFATTSGKYGRKAAKRKVVRDTWRAPGDDDCQTTYDPKRKMGVLVGRLVPEYGDVYQG